MYRPLGPAAQGFDPGQELLVSCCVEAQCSRARVGGGVNRKHVRELSVGTGVYIWARLKGKVGTGGGEATEEMWRSAT